MNGAMTRRNQESANYVSYNDDQEFVDTETKGDNNKQSNGNQFQHHNRDLDKSDKSTINGENGYSVESIELQCRSFTDEREAYAASTALMGETVFDSPNEYSRPTISTEALSDAKSMSVGIMAQGLSWARRQRERRQRLHLQNQAEMQLRKIRKAQAEEEKAAKENTRSLMDNPTFQNLMRIAAAGLDPEPDTGTSAKSPAGIRGLFSKQSSESFDEDNGDHKISKSEAGGYSVELPIAEDKEEEMASWVPPVRIQQTERDMFEAVAASYILTADEMQQIAVHVLPRGIVYCPWQRIYSLARDGDSFEACIHAIGSEKQTLLVFRTSQNAVFGGFADSPWEQSGGYTGGIYACLFRVVNNAKATENTTNHDDEVIENNDCENAITGSDSPKSPSSMARPTIVQAYKWTGANRYVQLCDPVHKMIAFGGGGKEGAFGLCVQQDFQIGSSGHCETFDNEPLAGDVSYFEIVDMEVWGFLIGQF